MITQYYVRLIAQLTVVVGGAVARALIQAYKDAAQRELFIFYLSRRGLWLS